MELIDRQIKAVQETLEQVMMEWWNGERHSFVITDCPFCIEFRTREDRCADCPLNSSKDMIHPCIEFVIEAREASLEEIAGFLKSLEISLEEMG